MRAFGVLSPELPPALGGVADYAGRLAEYWPGPAPRLWWVAAGAAATAELWPDRKVRLWGAEPSGLGEVECLLVNYTQYGYEGTGIPWRLVLGLRRWRRGGAGRRLGVFFHETWLRGALWKRRGLAAPWARLCARALVREADAVATNCDRHARQLCDRSAMPVLPVPSNIPVLARREAAPRATRLRVGVFGLPETRLRALRAHGAFVAWLAREGHLEELVLLGGGAEEDRFARAARTLAQAAAGPRVRRSAARSPAEISAELARADLGLSGYAADEVGKSGTLAALFTHGCAVGCSGHDAGGIAWDFALDSGGAPRNWGAWNSAELRLLRHLKARAYSETKLSWSAHAAQVSYLMLDCQ